MSISRATLIDLGANPGRIKAAVPVHLPRPRDQRSPAFDTLVDQLSFEVDDLLPLVDADVHARPGYG